MWLNSPPKYICQIFFLNVRKIEENMFKKMWKHGWIKSWIKVFKIWEKCQENMLNTFVKSVETKNEKKEICLRKACKLSEMIGKNMKNQFIKEVK